MVGQTWGAAVSLILCVDVGLANIGAVVVDPTLRNSAGHARIVQYAFCHTERSDKKARWRHSDDRARRCAEGFRFINGLIRALGINRVMAELPSGGAPNSAAATDLASAATMLVCAIEASECAFEYYDPKEVKLAATGKRTASKREVMQAIAVIYPEILEVYPTIERREHVSDAVAVWLAGRNSSLARL